VRLPSRISPKERNCKNQPDCAGISNSKVIEGEPGTA
jgi:hypothetical protein